MDSLMLKEGGLSTHRPTTDDVEAQFTQATSRNGSQCTKRETRLEAARKDFERADQHRLSVETELDALLCWSNRLRSEMTNLAQPFFEAKNTSDDDPDQHALQERYLTLSKKNHDLDLAVERVKADCAAARANAAHLHTKFQKLHSKRSGLAHLWFHATKVSSAVGPSGLFRSVLYDGVSCGELDAKALAEQFIVAWDNALNVAAVVGGLGAGMAYTTLFSATRGRLDIVGWAFACFLLVLMNCAGLQVLLEVPRTLRLEHLLRTERLAFKDRAEGQLIILVGFLGIPLLAGIALLSLSVALLDPDAPAPVTGISHAVSVAGYIPIGVLGYYSGVLFLFTFFMSRDGRYRFNRHQVGVLPGGEEYAAYRARQIARAAQHHDTDLSTEPHNQRASQSWPTQTFLEDPAQFSNGTSNIRRATRPAETNGGVKTQ